MSGRARVISFFPSGKGKTHLSYTFRSIFFGGRQSRKTPEAAVLHILGSYSQSVSHMNSGVYFLNEGWSGACLVATGH